MMNKKQIDNLSRLCYDIIKLMIGLPVLGNVLSDKFSVKALWIGVMSASVFLVVGLLLDRWEVDKNVRH